LHPTLVSQERCGSPRPFGHFGASGSFLWVDPRARLAGAALSGRDFGPWALEAWPGFTDEVRDEFAGGRWASSAAAGPRWQV
jgi:CubicO group peptidase (beta-lactamase class C family)